MANWNERFNNASKFWLDDSYTYTRNTYTGPGSDQNARVAKMMQIHKACANFVKILTGRSDIKVRFSGEGQSYTDGSSVVIAANTKEDEFDVTVGLCLHEASHCVLTNFAAAANIKSEGINGELFQIVNWVEDRRIDAYVYKNAPGYRDYYEALYNKYFHSPIIDTGLSSNYLRKEDFESYIFRISNIMNSNSDLKALKELQEISDLIDLPNIDRLTSTMDAVNLARNVYEIIKKAEAAIPPPPPEQQNQDGKSGEGDNKEKGDNKTDSKSDDSAPRNDAKDESKGGKDEKDKKDEKGEKGDSKDEVKNKTDNAPEGKGDGKGDDSKPGDDSKDASSGTDATKLDNSKPEELSHRQIDILDRALINQRKFTDNTIEKTRIKGDDANLIKNLNEIQADVEFIIDSCGRNLPCFMYELNDALLTGSDPHKLFERGMSSGYPKAAKNYCESVEEGLALGAVLGNKLKMHDENRELITSHRSHGKLDKRLIASLGSGLESVFYDKHTDKHTAKSIYITVDGSGSMSAIDNPTIENTYCKYKDSRFYKSQVAVIAMIKACTMIQSIRIIVDYRFAAEGSIVCLRAFDSKKDKISKVVNMFKYLRTMGGTPEGYAMAIPLKKGDIAKGSQNLKSYYINLSDGDPSFAGSVEHTKKLVDEIRSNGVKIMSYFIGKESSVPLIFRKMYGVKDSHMIKVNQLLPLAKSLNKMFMES